MFVTRLNLLHSRQSLFLFRFIIINFYFEVYFLLKVVLYIEEPCHSSFSLHDVRYHLLITVEPLLSGHLLNSQPLLNGQLSKSQYNIVNKTPIKRPTPIKQPRAFPRWRPLNRGSTVYNTKMYFELSLPVQFCQEVIGFSLRLVVVNDDSVSCSM